MKTAAFKLAGYFGHGYITVVNFQKQLDRALQPCMQAFHASCLKGLTVIEIEQMHVIKPGSDPDTSFTYDNFSRVLTSVRDGQTLTNVYDALSRAR